MFRLLIALILSVSVTHSLQAGVKQILPTPHKVEAGAGEFVYGRPVSINDATGTALLRAILEKGGCDIVDKADANVVVRMVENVAPGIQRPASLDGFPSERYTLRVSPDSIIIEAEAARGVLRAAQTLAQLETSDGNGAECVEIIDYPDFIVRGYMHDTGRSFIPLDEIKKQMEILSAFKVNVFHWHLTENQAWRFGVKAYPQLTSAESMTRDAGLFYTAEECRELERFADSLGITVIPEIDMPGHSAAYERAMGHSMQTPEGVEELKVILEEVAEAFPLAPYVHIGADEVAITYPDFVEIMAEKVHSLGKKVVAWNPIHGRAVTPESGIDLTQLWSTRGLAVKGIPAIDCRYNYANHFDVYADLAGIFFSNIYYRDMADSDVAGTIQAYWNDRLLPSADDIAVQNNLYANVIAMAERAWRCGEGRQYIEERGVGLTDDDKELEEFRNWEDRFMHYKSTLLPADQVPYYPQSHIEWTLTDSKLRKANARGAGVYLRHTWNPIIPSRLPFYMPGDTVWAERTVISPRDMEVDAYVEFQNYSRSETDLAPDAGCWDRKGSRLWVNDDEILPPVWDNSGKEIGRETALGNENMSARPPLKIALKEGENHVKVMVPCVDAPGVRLNKWMFTVMLVDPQTGESL